MTASRFFNNTQESLIKESCKDYQFYQKGNFSRVTSIVYLNNDQIAFTERGSQFVKFIDLKTKEKLSKRLCNGLSEVRQISLLPNQDLVSLSEGFIKVWDLNTCKPKIGFGADQIRLLVLRSGDIASASKNGTISIWEPQTGTIKQLLIGHKSWVTSLAVLSSGEIVSSADDSTLRIWDIQNGCCKKIIDESEPALNVNTMPDDNLITFDCTGRIKIYEASTGKNTYIYQARPTNFILSEIMPDGNIAFFEGNHIAIFDTKNRTIRRQLSERDNSEKWIITISPTGEIITASEDGIFGYNESAFEQQNQCAPFLKM